MVIYTVLLGDKESLGSPLSALDGKAGSDLHIDFICFTDNRALASDVWKFVYIDNHNLPAEKLSRRPKALPHEYLSDWTHSLYIDNVVTFKRLPCTQDLVTERPYLFKVFRHSHRANLQQEADAIVMLGYDDVDTVCGQLDFYAGIRPLESIVPIHTCTVILRSHLHPAVIAHGIAWWEQILCFSKRDQMSFDFAAKQSGCGIEPLPGLKHDSDLIASSPNTGNNRVKANFDAVKYAWLHRQNREARQNPKAHFLAMNHESDQGYTKRIRLLDHICHTQHSSLGDMVAPRRAIADALGDILAPFRHSSGHLLLTRIRDDTAELGFSEEEFGPAAASIAIMLHRHMANALEIHAEQIRSSGAGFTNADFLYDIIVLFGLPADTIHLCYEKLAGLLNPVRGLIVIVASGKGNLTMIDHTRQQISKRFAVDCDVAVSHSRHDSADAPIANSLICFQWQASDNPGGLR